MFAKSLQSCPTLCDPIDGSPTGFPVPGIVQARTLEWVAISFSNVWKWKVKVKSFSRVRLFATPWAATYPTRLLRPWDFLGKSTGMACHCLLRDWMFMCPQNSCVETLIPSLMVFGDEDFRRQWGHEGGIIDGTREFLRGVQFSCSVVSNSLRPHELQHSRPPCPSPTPRVHPNPCPLSR